MPRIAFAWELGGALGHAMSCAGLARSLHARGHRIAFMFRDLAPLALIPETAAYERFQAPVFATEGVGAALPSSLADILLGCGYAKVDVLSELLAGWMKLLREWKPDLVIGDYAPTAILAARALGLKRASLGIPFAVPPRLTPLPAFRFDQPPPPERLARADAQALANVNAALASAGAAPLAALHEMFETDEDFLCSFPELDAYGNRPTARYWGPRFRDDAGVSVHWPAGRGPRVLVYARTEVAQLDALIDALASGPYRVAAFIHGLDAQQRARLRAPQRIVSEKPMRYSALLPGCDVFVSTGGTAATGALMSGVAQLVFPLQYEQYLTARRIAQIGAGVVLLPEANAPQQVAGALRALVADPRYRQAARAFAQRYPAYSPAEQQRRIVARVEEMLASPSRSILAPASKPGDAPR